MKKELTTEELKSFAQQLSCPQGEMGIEVARFMNESNLNLTEKTIEMLKLKKSESVIEVGIGNGQLSLPVLNQLGPGGSYLGIDLSQDMIYKATELFESKGLKNYKFICSDVQSVQLIETYNKFFAVNLLYFIDDLESFIQKIKIWLKPNGKMFFAVRSKETLEKLPVTQFGFNLRSLDESLEVLNKCHLKNIEVSTFEETVDMNTPIEIDFKLKNHIISGVCP